MSPRDRTDHDQYYLNLALAQARRAEKFGEVPVGAVAVSEGKVIARAYNQKEKKRLAHAHAEVELLTKIAKKRKDWRLNDVTVYVTLEPCPLCAAALQQYRVRRVVYGTSDPKGGALSLGFLLNQSPKLNHRFPMELVYISACSEILTKFFRAKRQKISL